MNIGVYGGSIRPGGGLTVLKQLIAAVANLPDIYIYVYTGEQDCSEGLSDLFATLNNVEEIRFFPRVNAELRYAISKLYFLQEANKKNLDVLISINYFIPALCETVVYHLNLLSFMRGDNDSIGQKVKRLDARIACRYATTNVFESNYLMTKAREQVRMLSNEKVVYVGVAPEFQCRHDRNVSPDIEESEKSEVIIAVVSSPSPHKDNKTALNALALLVNKRANVKWRMIFVGGLSREGWDETEIQAERMGVSQYVTFSGPIEKESLSALLGKCLCLVSTSLIESFCMVAVEAMKSCCPAIVTNSTSMPESVGNAGIVVQAREPDGFCNAIEKLYDNEQYREEVIREGLVWSEQFEIQRFEENISKVLSQR